MTEWWDDLAMWGGILGLLLLCCLALDWCCKEFVRGVRDIWHEKDEEKAETAPRRRRRRRLR